MADIPYDEPKEIGSGDTRKAYLVSEDDHDHGEHPIVVKAGAAPVNFQEYQTWEYVGEHEELQSEFAEVYEIDEEYEWIAMQYADTRQGTDDDINTTAIQNHGFSIGVLKDSDYGVTSDNMTILVDFPWGRPDK